MVPTSRKSDAEDLGPVRFHVIVSVVVVQKQHVFCVDQFMILHEEKV